MAKAAKTSSITTAARAREDLRHLVAAKAVAAVKNESNYPPLAQENQQPNQFPRLGALLPGTKTRGTRWRSPATTPSNQASSYGQQAPAAPPLEYYDTPSQGQGQQAEPQYDEHRSYGQQQASRSTQSYNYGDPQPSPQAAQHGSYGQQPAARSAQGAQGYYWQQPRAPPAAPPAARGMPGLGLSPTTSTTSPATPNQNMKCERCVATRRFMCTWHDDPLGEQCDGCFKATKDPNQYKIPCVPARGPEAANPALTPSNFQHQPVAQDKQTRWNRCQFAGPPACGKRVPPPIQFCVEHSNIKGGPGRDDDPKPKKDKSKKDKPKKDKSKKERPSDSKKVKSSR
ncbi:hypothetical protein QBC34DRAFT_383505 [Podospora aff. communis PSN243]|uniref:Uncharacterized protein n=1 Tax=Podospora aff. communis PSN243 TaxID=3040156 RepID=A0AAV9GD38_9PEZI|nr:hypothetical protein QBC34DRAFT_383505 [Podospora aff. communis PSN243]